MHVFKSLCLFLLLVIFFSKKTFAQHATKYIAAVDKYVNSIDSLALTYHVDLGANLSFKIEENIMVNDSNRSANYETYWMFNKNADTLYRVKNHPDFTESFWLKEFYYQNNHIVFARATFRAKQIGGGGMVFEFGEYFEFSRRKIRKVTVKSDSLSTLKSLNLLKEGKEYLRKAFTNNPQ